MSNLTVSSHQSLGSKDAEDSSTKLDLDKQELDTFRFETVHSEEPEKICSSTEDPIPVVQKKNYLFLKFIIPLVVLLIFSAFLVFLPSLTDSKSSPKSYYIAPKKNQVFYSSSRNLASKDNNIIEYSYIILDEDINSKQIMVVPSKLNLDALRNLRERYLQDSESKQPDSSNSSSNTSAVVFLAEVDMNFGTIVSFYHPLGTHHALIKSCVSAIRTMLINGRYLERVVESGENLTTQEEYGMFDYNTTYIVEETEEHQIVTTVYDKPEINRRKLGPDQEIVAPEKIYIKKTTVINKGSGFIDKTNIVGIAAFEIVNLYNEGGHGSNVLNLDFSFTTEYSEAGFGFNDDEIKQISENVKEYFKFVQLDLERYDSGKDDISSEKIPEYHNEVEETTEGGNRQLIVSELVNHPMFKIFGTYVYFNLKVIQSGDNLIATAGIKYGSMLTIPFPSHTYGWQIIRLIRQMITLKNREESGIQFILNIVTQANELFPSMQSTIIGCFGQINNYLNTLWPIVDGGFANLDSHISNHILINPSNSNEVHHFFIEDLLDPIDNILQQQFPAIASCANPLTSINIQFNGASVFISTLSANLLSSANNLNNLPRSNSIALSYDLFDFSGFDLKLTQINSLFSTMQTNENTLMSLISAQNTINSNLLNTIFNIATWTNQIQDRIDELDNSLLDPPGGVFDCVAQDTMNVVITHIQTNFITPINNLLQTLSNLNPLQNFISQHPALSNTLLQIQQILHNLENVLRNTFSPPNIVPFNKYYNLFSSGVSLYVYLPVIITPIGSFGVGLGVSGRISLALNITFDKKKLSFTLTPSAQLGFHAGVEYFVIVGAIGAGAEITQVVKLPFEFGCYFHHPITFYDQGTLQFQLNGQSGVYYRLLQVWIEWKKVCIRRLSGGGGLGICFYIPIIHISYTDPEFIDALSSTFTISSSSFSVIPYHSLSLRS